MSGEGRRQARREFWYPLYESSRVLKQSLCAGKEGQKNIRRKTLHRYDIAMIEKLRWITRAYRSKGICGPERVPDGSGREKSPTKIWVAFLSLFRILSDSDVWCGLTREQATVNFCAHSRWQVRSIVSVMQRIVSIGWYRCILKTHRAQIDIKEFNVSLLLW